MNVETYKFLLGVAAFLITFFLGGILYFLKIQINTIKEVKTLVDFIRRTQAVDKQSSEDMKVSCAKTHKIVDKRLDEHGERLDKHEKDIVILKERIKK